MVKYFNDRTVAGLLFLPDGAKDNISSHDEKFITYFLERSHQYNIDGLHHLLFISVNFFYVFNLVIFIY
jgi:hypothetical protein